MLSSTPSRIVTLVRFFLPVRVLSRVFRGKFADGVRELHSFGRLKFHGWLAPLAVLAVGRAFGSSSALTNPLFHVAVCTPTVSSLALAALLGAGRCIAAIARVFAPVARAGIQWYLIVLAGHPLAGLLAGRAAGLFGAALGSMPNWTHFYGALVPALVVDPGPLGEELGRRGFAFPACWSAGSRSRQA